ncbi:MATE family efflux transporter, partial [Campylobacter upsaliensis]|nr:MATE family efflux transporter [Campylobacter upsaliensis]
MSKQLSLKQLSVPIFCEMFLRYLSLIINTVMVSQYSNSLVGAMGAGNQILDLFITIFSFLSVGCSVVIAQALGARNFTLARKVIHQSLFLNALLGFFCMLFILWQGDFLLTLLKIPNELLKDSQIYLHMLAICLFFDAIGIVMAAVVRVYNHAFFVMFVTLLMDGFIIFGNYIVLHHTSLELFGIGLSNVIGRVLAIITLLLILIFKLKIHLKLREMIALEKEVVKK